MQTKMTGFTDISVQTSVGMVKPEEMLNLVQMAVAAREVVYGSGLRLVPKQDAVERLVLAITATALSMPHKCLKNCQLELESGSVPRHANGLGKCCPRESPGVKALGRQQQGVNQEIVTQDLPFWIILV